MTDEIRIEPERLDELATDEDGDPTTDPGECHALRPLGGHKGDGLAFVVEGLCGILMDAAFGDSVPNSYDEPGDPQELTPGRGDRLRRVH